MNFTLSDIAAFYAAIVATGALALEVRRWFESGVRVRLTCSHVYSAPHFDQHAVLAELTNIGDAATTLTGMELWGYPSRIHALFGMSQSRTPCFNTSSFAGEGVLPHVIEPGQTWRGSISAYSGVEGDQRFNVRYVAINNTRYTKPFTRMIK